MEVLEAVMDIIIMVLVELVPIITAVEEHLVLSLAERQELVTQEALIKILDQRNKTVAQELQQFQELIHQDRIIQ
jgi:chorismate mutase